MPVFSRMQDDVLVLTADGDFTADELGRVGQRFLSEGGHPGPYPVVLDVSGASGLDARASNTLVAEAEALAPLANRFDRLAVVVASRYAPLFAAGSAFAERLGVQVQTCTSRGEAVRWLQEGSEQ